MKLFYGLVSVLGAINAIKLDVDSQIDRLHRNAKIYSPNCNVFLSSLDRFHDEYLSLQVLSDDQLVNLISTIDFSRFPDEDQFRCKLGLLKRTTRSFVATKARLEAMLSGGRLLPEDVEAIFRAYLNPDERLAGIPRITGFEDRNPRSEQTVLEIYAWRRNYPKYRSDGTRIPLPNEPFLGPVAYDGRHLLPAAVNGDLFSTDENIQKVAMALMEFYAGKVAEARNQSIVYVGIPSFGTRYYGPRDDGQLFVWGTYVKPDTLTCFSHNIDARKHEPFPFQLSCFDRGLTGTRMFTFENNFAVGISYNNRNIVASLLRFVCDDVRENTDLYPSYAINIVPLESLPLIMRQASIATAWLFKKVLLLNSYDRRFGDLSKLLKIPGGFKMNWDRELDIMFSELMTGKVIGLDAPEIPEPVVAEEEQPPNVPSEGATSIELDLPLDALEIPDPVVPALNGQPSNVPSNDETSNALNHRAGADHSRPHSSDQVTSETEHTVVWEGRPVEPLNTLYSPNESTTSNNPPQHEPPKRQIKEKSANNSSDIPKSNFWVYLVVAAVAVICIVAVIVVVFVL